MRTFFGGLFLILGLAAIALAQEGGRTLDQPAAPAQHPDGTISYVAKDGSVTIEVKGMEMEGVVLLHPLVNGVLHVSLQDENTRFAKYVSNAKKVTLKNAQFHRVGVGEDGKSLQDCGGRTWTLVSGDPLPSPKPGDTEPSETFVAGETVWESGKPRELTFTAEGRVWRCVTDLVVEQQE